MMTSLCASSFAAPVLPIPESGTDASATETAGESATAAPQPADDTQTAADNTPAPVQTLAPVETVSPVQTVAPVQTVTPVENAATVAAFNASAFSNNASYTVLGDKITVNAKAAGYIENDKGSFDIGFEISGTSPYVVTMTATYTGGVTPVAQKLVFMTSSHQFSYTPTVSFDSLNGQNVETMKVILGTREAFELLKDLGSDYGIQFSILGSARTLEGVFSAMDKNVFTTFYNDYINASGFSQDLTAVANTNPCDVVNIAQGYAANYNQNYNYSGYRNGSLYASPASGRFYNQYNSVVLTSNAGDTIHYDTYIGATCTASGTVKSGESVWLAGTANSCVDVYLSAYVVGNPSNSIYCTYTVDCSVYYYNGSSVTTTYNNAGSTYSVYDSGVYYDVTWINGTRYYTYDGVNWYPDDGYVYDPMDGYDPSAYSYYDTYDPYGYSYYSNDYYNNDYGVVYNNVNGKQYYSINGSNWYPDDGYVYDPMDGYDASADFKNWVNGYYSENADKYQEMMNSVADNDEWWSSLTSEQDFYDRIEEGLAAYDIPAWAG